eukprot:104052_1
MPKAKRKEDKPRNKWFVVGLGVSAAMILISFLVQFGFDFRSGQINWSNVQPGDAGVTVNAPTQIATLGVALQNAGVMHPQNFADPMVQKGFKKVVSLKVKNCNPFGTNGQNNFVKNVKEYCDNRKFFEKHYDDPSSIVSEENVARSDRINLAQSVMDQIKISMQQLENEGDNWDAAKRELERTKNAELLNQLIGGVHPTAVGGPSNAYQNVLDTSAAFNPNGYLDDIEMNGGQYHNHNHHTANDQLNDHQTPDIRLPETLINKSGNKKRYGGNKRSRSWTEKSEAQKRAKQAKLQTDIDAKVRKARRQRKQNDVTENMRSVLGDALGPLQAVFAQTIPILSQLQQTMSHQSDDQQSLGEILRNQHALLENIYSNTQTQSQANQHENVNENENESESNQQHANENGKEEQD